MSADLSAPQPPSLRERRTRQTRLEISAVAVDLFAEHGFAETTVEDVATAAGVSTRTFHRYFATKEDAVAPVLGVGWQGYADAFARRPADEPVIDGLVAALTESWDSASARRHRTFLRMLTTTPALEASWLRVFDGCAEALRPLLAARLNLDPESPAARFTALCVSSAGRVASETWAARPRTRVVDVARDSLITIAGALLTPDGGTRGGGVSSARR